MKISEKLYNMREYDYANTAKRKNPYHAVLSFDDFTELAREMESQINMRDTVDGLFYADIRLFRSRDAKNGEVELW